MNKKIREEQNENRNGAVDVEEGLVEEGQSKKKWLTVIIPLAFVVFCVVVAFAFVFLRPSKNSEMQSTGTLNKKTENQAPKEVKFLEGTLECQEDWQEYRNDVLGLAFCYPLSWGEPKIQHPRYLTRISKMKEDFERLNVYYENSLDVRFEDNDKISILFFNDEFNGKSQRGINEPYVYYSSGATEQVLGLKKSGDICAYNVDYSYRYNPEMKPGKMSTIFSKCGDGAKTLLVEHVQYFSSKTLYTYNLDMLSFIKIANGFFDNVLIRQGIDSAHQIKEKLNTLDEFFEKDNKSASVQKGLPIVTEAELSEAQKSFKVFVNSFSVIKVEQDKQVDFEKISGEDPSTAVIRKYYWLIENGMFPEAYALNGASAKNLNEFKKWYENVYQAKPRDFVSLGGNSYEFHVDYQDHNDKPKDYRVKMTIENGKIKSSESEEITDQPVFSGNYSAYVKRKGDVNYIILVENGKEIIVDQGYADYDKYNIGEVKFFNIEEFSPSGKYLIYGMSGWEWHLTYIYDPIAKKQILKIDGPGKYGFTKNEEAFYHCMSPGMMDGSGTIYSAPGFQKEYDIYSSNSKVAQGYMNIECDYIENGNYVVFYLDNEGVADQSYEKKEVRFYLDTKKEDIL